MSKQILLAGVAATMFLVGCQATANVALDPAAAAAAAAAGGTTTTNPNGTTTTTNSGSLGLNVDAAAIYKQGRKWKYETTTTAAGIATPATTMEQEVIKVEGNKATVKTTVVAAGVNNTSESTTDLSANPDWAKQIGSSSSKGASSTYTFTQSASGQESITVKAGQFAATKVAGKLVYSGSSGAASASGDQDVTYWVSNTVGLLKSEVKGSQSMSAGYEVKQLPAGMPDLGAMLGGAASGGTSAIPTMSTSVSFSSVMELVSVDPK